MTPSQEALTDADIKRIHDTQACLPDLVGLKDQWPEILRFARAVIDADRKARQQDALPLPKESRAMSEPRPCPFCGEAPSLDSGPGVWREHHTYRCFAPRCIMATVNRQRTWPTPAKALSAWNTRASAPQQAQDTSLPPWPTSFSYRYSEAAPSQPPQGASSLLPGWRLVPVEPTEEMVLAGVAAAHQEPAPSAPKRARNEYRAMLAASPLPAPQEPVWIQPDHLAKARLAPFLCRVEPKQRDDFVPLYAAPAPDSTQGTP